MRLTLLPPSVVWVLLFIGYVAGCNFLIFWTSTGGLATQSASGVSAVRRPRNKCEFLTYIPGFPAIVC